MDRYKRTRNLIIAVVIVVLFEVMCIVVFRNVWDLPTSYENKFKLMKLSPYMDILRNILRIGLAIDILAYGFKDFEGR